MIYTAENPHADGSATPGARTRLRLSSHLDPPATSRTHNNWKTVRQTYCCQQTAPPQQRCSKDVTTHQHLPGSRPGRPCPVPARSGQTLSSRIRFIPAFGTEFFSRSVGTPRRVNIAKSTRGELPRGSEEGVNWKKITLGHV